jgi:hypothetical protein
MEKPAAEKEIDEEEWIFWPGSLCHSTSPHLATNHPF